MGNFLDKAGLGIVWGLIKNGFITKNSVQAKSTTLSWATETEIANIDGKSIKITLPSNPDTDNNTARLQISDTTNRRINTKESTAEYIQFTPGTNKFTVGDGTSSFDVPITISNDSHDHDSRYLKLTGGILTGDLTIDSNVPHIAFTRHDLNYITVPEDGTLAIGIGSSGVNTRLAVDSTSVYPGYNNGTISLGASNYYWGTIYGNSFVKKDGTSSQFLKADGSVDSNSYSTTSHTHQITVISGTEADGTTNITSTSTAATNPSVTLADSGVGAGTYGPTANVTNGSISIPCVQVNSKGIVTGLSTKTFTANVPTVYDGTLSIKTKVGNSETVVSSFSANQNTNSPVSIVFQQGNNITLTPDTANKRITIDATDTTYSAGSGLTLDGTTFKHSNSVSAKTAYGSTSTTASANNGTITVTDVQYDAQGHITSTTDRTITLSQDHTASNIQRPDGNWTAGTNEATQGSTIDVPYLTVNSAGHITGFGTHVHTVTGFSDSGHNHDSTYLKLSGGTLSNNQAVISREGNSALWVEGRDYPIIKSTSYTGYNAILSMKTTNGSWDLGVYGDDYAYLTYITDSNYSAGTNTITHQLTFPKTTGTLATTSNIGSANLNLKVNGAANTSFSANATSAVDFNIGTGSASGTISVGGVNVTVKDIAGAAYKAVDTSITAGSSSTNVPTSQAVASLVSSALTSALIYKGTIGSSGADITALPASHKVGDVYVVAKAGTFAGKACEVGDYIICKTAGTSANDAHWNVVNGENQVENKSASLAGAGDSATIATVDGTDITVTTPSTWTGLTKVGTITGVGNTTSGAVTVSSSNNTAAWSSAVTVGSVGGVDLKFTMPGNPNSDTKVTQTVTNSSSHTSWRPLVLGYSSSDATVFAPTTVTNTVFASHLAKFKPSTGLLALVGLNKLGTDGKIVAGSDTTVWNTNGGTTSLSSYLTDQDHYKTSPTSGSYGPSADVSGSNGTELLVPYITVNEYGHVTSIVNKKYTSVDHTYTVNNGTYTIKTKVGDTVTNVSDFKSNQSGTDDVTFIAGTNVSLTPDATNRTITISSTDTNTHNSHGHTFTASAGSALTPAHGGKITVVTALGNASATTGNLSSTYTTQEITLPSETALSKGTTTGEGNAVTDITVSGHTITLKKESTFSLSTHTHNTVNAIYTTNGGQQGPSYFGTNRAGFLMSNATVNGDSHYKNWIYVDAYNGNDAGGATALGLDRTEARAFIMQSDATRASWNNTAEIITTANVGSYSTSDTALTESEILAILT